MKITDTQSCICYGYSRNAVGKFVEDNSAAIVRRIFLLYLSGHSLRSIVAWLGENKVTSPSGKEFWTPKTIDKLLSNETYRKGIITAEQFAQVQLEKQRRSNQMQTEAGLVRKPIRYHSQNGTKWAFCLRRMRPKLPSNHQARWQHCLEVCKLRGTWQGNM